MKTDSDLVRPELRSEACFDAEVVPHLLSREERRRARIGLITLFRGSSMASC
jgi:hypothetical protein